jgi:hypothetical protein
MSSGRDCGITEAGRWERRELPGAIGARGRICGELPPPPPPPPPGASLRVDFCRILTEPDAE